MPLATLQWSWIAADACTRTPAATLLVLFAWFFPTLGRWPLLFSRLGVWQIMALAMRTWKPRARLGIAGGFAERGVCVC